MPAWGRVVWLAAAVAWLPACALIDAASTNKDNDDGVIDAQGSAHDAAGSSNCLPETGVCFQSMSLGSAVDPGLLALADLDNDSWWDVVVAGASGVEIFWGNNAGGVETSTALSLATGAAYIDLVVGDFDDNEHLDIAVVDADERAIGVYRNQGARVFDPVVNPTITRSVASIELIDYDASGSDDLLVIPTEGQPFAMYSTGDPVLTQGADIAAAADAERIVVGEFIGEGYPDIAVQRGEMVYRLHGFGDGTFESYNNSDPQMEIISLVTLVKPLEGNDWIAAVGYCEGCSGAKLVSVLGGESEEAEFGLDLDIDFTGIKTVTGHFFNAVEQGVVILNGATTRDHDLLILDTPDNRAGQAFDVWALLDSANPGALDVATADFNKDGVDDIVVVGGGVITILYSASVTR